MKIIKAIYGSKDVTNQVNALMRNDRLDITAGNSLFGDPAVGTVKHLVVDFEIDGLRYTRSAREGEQMNVPETPHDRLGVFYTNNHNPKIFDIINLSLSKIKVASNGKADIITSVFQPIRSNPFPQYQSWMKVGSHLNQCLQILQLFYIAAKRKSYKYVSFLEHDVLYPEGHFDYPDFESGNVMTNMNYMGLCEEGWQSRKQNDEPLHQMTMTFEDAVNHFQSVFQNALVVNSGLLENQNLNRKQWQSENPAVHMYHGHHFTSHHNIYSTDNYQSLNEYWGDKDRYLHVLPKKEGMST